MPERSTAPAETEKDLPDGGATARLGLAPTVLGLVARSAGPQAAVATALASRAGNRAMGKVLARKERTYQDSPLASNAPTMDAAGVDTQIERLKADPGKKPGLGTIDGLTNADPKEAHRVKYLIWQYYEFGKLRNTEVDTVIMLPQPININDTDPLGTTPPDKKILWTIKFETDAQKVTNVSADRIGEADYKLSIAATRDFPGTKPLAELVAWVAGRYPSLASVKVPEVKPAQTGSAPPTEAQQATANAQAREKYLLDLNTELRKQARTPDFFKTNYGIEILDAATGATRLEAAHKWSEGRRAGTKAWEPEKLEQLQLALETIGTTFLTALRGLKMIRKRVRLVAAGKTFTEAPGTYGETVMTKVGSNTDVSIVIYDSHADQDDRRFIGSRNRGVRPAGVMQLLHELGHAVSYMTTTDLEAAFNKKFQGAPTAYGKSAVVEEFPELFALYHGDPDYLHDEWKDRYDWMESASTSGKPP